MQVDVHTLMTREEPGSSSKRYSVSGSSTHSFDSSDMSRGNSVPNFQNRRHRYVYDFLAVNAWPPHKYNEPAGAASQSPYPAHQ